MSRVNVTHDIDDLANDLQDIAVRAKVELPIVVEQHAADVQRIAAASARRQSGSHGKHYPKAITAEARSPLLWEIGPDVNKKQGGMAFEDGPGPQTRPHNNLRKAADLVGPQFENEVGDRVDGWFW